MTPAVSVVVPTIGRPGLDDLLRTLRAPSDHAREIVVVDNTPHATVTLDGDGAGARVRLVHEPRPGAAAARNRGIAEASGRVVVFLDDDIRIDAATVDALAGPVLRGEADATTGRVVLDPAVTLPRWVTPPLPGYLSRHDRGDDPHDVAADDHGLTAAMAVDREVLVTVGGFWERLGPRPGHQRTDDDVQLCRALHRAGARIRHEPAAVVVHEVPAARLRPSFIVRRAAEQGRADWLLERGWERRAFTSVLAGSVRDAATELVGHARRLHRGPGTAMRVTCTVARLGGLVAGALVEPTP